MNSVRRSAFKLLGASLIAAALLLAENSHIQDPVFRRQLIVVTSGCWLIAGALLGVQIIWESIKLRLGKHAQSRIKPIRAAVVIVIVIGYLLTYLVTTVNRIHREAGSPNAIDVAGIIVFSCAVVFGVLVLIRMITHRED